MPDFTIRGLTVSDVPGVNGALQPTVLKQVKWYVGNNGPFTANFSQAEYNADAVITAINKEVEILKAITAGAGVTP